MKKFLQLKLKFLTKLILKKYQPKVIAITGSVGKTGTKEAIYSAFRDRKNTRESYKNYNNEIGVPLSVIGVDKAPGKSLIRWSIVFLQALKLILSRDETYPEVLILEMGIDKPGDMSYLTSLVKPDISVITGVNSSHLEFFNSISHIKQEKENLVKATKPEGRVILNADNNQALDMKHSSKAAVFTYSLDKPSDFRAKDIVFNYEKTGEENNFSINQLTGANFKLNYKGSIIPITLDEVMAKSSIYSILSALAVSEAFDFNLIEVASSLQSHRPPSGRVNLVKGIKHTFLLDDTYNSSPASCDIALETLKKMKMPFKSRKLVALGDMLELGKATRNSHYDLGKKIGTKEISEIVLVGSKTWETYQGAVDAGFSKDNIYHFDEAESAGKFLQNQLQEHDVLLIKGSQGMRMEKVTKELMAQPLKADKLLVRQGDAWVK